MCSKPFSMVAKKFRGNEVLENVLVFGTVGKTALGPSISCIQMCFLFRGPSLTIVMGTFLFIVSLLVHLLCFTLLGESF